MAKDDKDRAAGAAIVAEAEAKAAVQPQPVENVINQPSNLSFGNQAPNSEGKILAGHPRLEEAWTWVTEEAFVETWEPLGWERAAINEDNVAYLPSKAEQVEEVATANTDTTEQVES